MIVPLQDSETFRALRHENFRHYFIGQAISQIGIWMQIAAIGWLVWRLTESKAMLGFVTFASRIPALFITVVGGVLADRYSRQKLVIVAQILGMIQALALAALQLSGNAQIWSITALAFTLGVISALDVPARQSFVVQLAGARDLPNALALNSLLFNFARIVGPAGAGWIVAASSEGVCFLANGLSYMIVIALLVRMKVPPREDVAPPARVGEQLREAGRFVRDHHAVACVLANMCAFSLMGYTHGTMLPAVAAESLGRDVAGYGTLMSASGFGALIGAIFLARKAQRDIYGRLISRAGILLGVSLVVFSFSHTFSLSCVLLIPSGAGMMIQASSTNILLQRLVPDRLRGRVLSFFSTTFLGLIPIGALILGLIAEQTDPLFAIRIGGIVCVISASWLWTQGKPIRASVDTLRKQAAAALNPIDTRPPSVSSPAP